MIRFSLRAAVVTLAIGAACGVNAKGREPTCGEVQRMDYMIFHDCVAYANGQKLVSRAIRFDAKGSHPRVKQILKSAANTRQFCQDLAVSLNRSSGGRFRFEFLHSKFTGGRRMIGCVWIVS